MITRRRFIAGAGALVIGAIALSRTLLLPVRKPVGQVPASGVPNPGSPAASSPSSAPAQASGRGLSPVALENQRPGSNAWDLDPAGSRLVEGYVGQPSVVAGDRLDLHASGNGPIDVEWWRLGWYQGDGGRLIRVDHGVKVPVRGAMPAPNPETGLIEAGWPAVLQVKVAPDWPSGMYVAVLRTPSHHDAFAPFVVREAPSKTPAPVLFVNAAATWQAYNGWGGKSLYGYNSTGMTVAVANPRAAVVSFDRPYDLDVGGGYLRRWELQFVRWQERDGRDVGYASDVDLALNPTVVDGRRLVVFAGHHEYWSRPMRETIQATIARGTNVAFLSANEIYWQVRLEDGPLGPASRIVCYKSAAFDPMTPSQPNLATCRWREDPVAAPETSIVGQMFGQAVAVVADWVVTNPGHWIYAGTGVQEGDHFVNLVGQEYDTLFPDLAPAGIEVIARGPVRPLHNDPHDPGAHPSPPIHTATVYTASSGATVVSAGTFQWSWAIDEHGDRSYHGRPTPFDQRVVRMSQNLFDRLGDAPSA